MFARTALALICIVEFCLLGATEAQGPKKSPPVYGGCENRNAVIPAAPPQQSNPSEGGIATSSTIAYQDTVRGGCVSGSTCIVAHPVHGPDGGTITFPAVPADARPIFGYLYFQYITTTDCTVDRIGDFANATVNGVNINTLPFIETRCRDADPCFPAGIATHFYRVDVSSLFQQCDLNVAVFELRDFGMGNDLFTDFVEGATLMVAYCSESSPPTDIILLEHAQVTGDGSDAVTTMSYTWSGFNADGVSASLVLGVGNGQSFSEAVRFSTTSTPSTVLGADSGADGLFDGLLCLPGPFGFGGLYDNSIIDVSGLVNPGDTSATLTITIIDDCLTSNPAFLCVSSNNAPSNCVPDACAQSGACCFPDGSCTQTPEPLCDAGGGDYQGDGTLCANVACPQPGACCFPATGACAQAAAIGGADCTAAGGVYQGDNTMCGVVECQQPNRVGATQKGSLLFFSKVELKWDVNGALVQDTFIQITNDNNAGVNVQMYFVNGDPPLAAIPAGQPGGPERAHPGWNNIDNGIYLTADQPSYWSALTGQPGSPFPPPSTGPVSPFTVLDPGLPPGRPDPDSPTSTDRVLRGFIIAFAVNNLGEEIKWNHLFGNATLVNYRDGTAWEYNAWAFPAVNPNIPTGAQTGTPGVINFDGFEFARGYDQLLFNFLSVGSSAFSSLANQLVATPDLTLHHITTDLRQNTTGPRTTKAKFDVWNQNEVKFSGAERCLTCWDQRLLGNWAPLANHFLRPNLQTNVGKARVNGEFSPVVCPTPPYPNNGAYPLLGVIATRLSFDGGLRRADAGTNVHGMGYESGTIWFDIMTPPVPGTSGRGVLRR